MCEELVEHPRQRGREDKSKALERRSSKAAGGTILPGTKEAGGGQEGPDYTAPQPTVTPVL